MTTARTLSIALSGLDGAVVEVEADLTPQTPGFRVIGLPDKAIGEAVQRVTNACANRNLPLPRRRLTVNLSPASVPKHGSGFDVAIAVAALATEHPLDAARLAATVHIGELGLDGRLRPLPGVLPAVLAAARSGVTRAVVPWANREEALLVDGIEVFGAVCLADVLRWHGAATDAPELDAVTALGGVEPVASDEVPDLADVIGQPEAVEAMVVAAAGGHHVLLSGPPGAGKTMLARRLPGILPPLDDDAALTAACVRSLAGASVTALSRTPPWEAPHHSASVGALVGGGSRIVRPGAIARASGGVLFLDEAGEFAASALDALRQPLESGTIAIHRAGAHASYPARFQLVLATNPCPCGQYGVPGGTCVCPPHAIRRYLGRLSGPLLDRIDIELSLRRVSVAHRDAAPSATTSAAARERVLAARDRTVARLADTPWRRNADVPGTWLRQGPLALAPIVRRPLDAALHRGALTLRGYDRVLRVAWTLADLAGRATVDVADIGRALFLKRGVMA
ncbi:YifB family Mg chelatase-like AAA ATPase [Microbacterium lushaniae]|uniref:YifB family Mg chelatase-like AAA ATPase n=1 Tax=Microbacterium lushaniae TaxID=2614639 RepID=A0A5J6L4C3_9MICO|nr:YifB family Mg chelatase-like AAA ATPase [Microbacterium lushaniae]QEW03388.1 YifB family Mg chelatase-like AAA ATPase [Microbacterium lushaniae]